MDTMNTDNSTEQGDVATTTYIGGTIVAGPEYADLFADLLGDDVALPADDSFDFSVPEAVQTIPEIEPEFLVAEVEAPDPVPAPAATYFGGGAPHYIPEGMSVDEYMARLEAAALAEYMAQADAIA